MAWRQKARPIIFVQTLGGARCEVSICPGWKVSELKREIEVKLRVSAAQQRLIHGCRALRDDDLDTAALSRLLAVPAGVGMPLELTLLVRSPAAAKMLAMVRKDSTALRHAPEELRSDKDIIAVAVRHFGQALQYATEELRGNKEIVLCAVAENGEALQHARDELKGDKEVVMRAVKGCGRALQHAAKELRGDKEVVVCAVAYTGEGLQHATEELKGDKELVTLAVKRSDQALQHASEELRGDDDIELKVLGLQVLILLLLGLAAAVLAALALKACGLDFADGSLQTQVVHWMFVVLTLPLVKPLRMLACFVDLFRQYPQVFMKDLMITPGLVFKLVVRACAD